MKFLVDNQLPVKLTQWLPDNGSEAEHVLDLGMAKTTDIEIWTSAISKEMIVVSKDVDFFCSPTDPPIRVGCFGFEWEIAARTIFWRGFRSRGRPFLTRSFQDKE